MKYKAGDIVIVTGNYLDEDMLDEARIIRPYCLGMYREYLIRSVQTKALGIFHEDDIYKLMNQPIEIIHKEIDND